MELVLRLLLTAVLAFGVLAKLARPRATSDAMETFGFDSPAGRWGAWSIAVLVEAVLAVGVATGSDRAAYLAAALMTLFALTLGSAVLRGRTGAPCACFGGGTKVGVAAIGRNLLLAAAFAALPSIPDSLTTDEWLTLGLAVSLAAVIALGIAVLALAREVGMLRLRVGPSSALEIGHEGPEVGGRTGLVDRFRFDTGADLALAVFSSDGCHVCRALEPTVESLRNEPHLSVEVFEEGRDRDVWEALAIPGAPYALALEPDGTVGAKGTFNNLAQLESIVATAGSRRDERRRRETLDV